MAAYASYTRRRLDLTPEIYLKWPTPNYINPEKRGPAIYIVNSLGFIVLFVAVTLRLYTRICIRKWFGLDDLFILLALVGAIGVTACVMLGTHSYQWDRHIWDMHLDLVTPSGQILFASKLLWSFTSNAVRASVLCLYYRLLQHIGLERRRWILHINALFIFGLFITQQASTVFACSPIKTVWTWPPIFGATCIDQGASMVANAALNTFSEFVMATLPIPVIMSMRMAESQRRAVIALLCGGYLVVIVGCVRTFYVYRLITTFDLTWWAQPHWILSEIEIDLAAVIACIPALAPVIQRVYSKGLSAAKERIDSHNSGCDARKARAKALFSKIVDHNTLLSFSRKDSATSDALETAETHRDLDLEGIENDGYGYTVTITTGNGTKVRKRWDIRNRTWHYYPRRPSVLENDELLSPMSTHGITLSQSLKPNLEITISEELSLERTMRDGSQVRSIAQRNAHTVSERRRSNLTERDDTRSMIEEHEENGDSLDLNRSQVSDWSVLGDIGSSRRVPTISTGPSFRRISHSRGSALVDPPSRPDSVYTSKSLRSQLHVSEELSMNNEGRNKRTSRNRLSRSSTQQQNHIRPNTSTTDASSRYSFPTFIMHRSTSQATTHRTLSKSHTRNRSSIASSPPQLPDVPPLPKLQLNMDMPSPGARDESLAAAMSDAWEQSRSSADGSAVRKEADRVSVANTLTTRKSTEWGDDESFYLPLQRPSPRHSTYGARLEHDVPPVPEIPLWLNRLE